MKYFTQLLHTHLSTLLCIMLFVMLFPVAITSDAHIAPAIAYGFDFGLAIGNMILGLASTITGVAGLLFDTSINHLVLGMGERLRNGGIGIVVNEVWGVVRDFANLVFIFGFIYIGIRTILQPDGADTKRFLAQLVIAALLINFSLFFTKVVIDVANVFALEIYNLMHFGEGGSIGWGIAHSAGLGSWYNPLSTENLANVTGDGAFAFFMMGALFLLITAFVLLGGAVMLIIRFVALIFIMIFSPLMFAFYIFPKTREHAVKLGKKLISYAFFAPIFLFLIYISIQVLQASPFSQSDLHAGLTSATANGAKPLDAYAVFLQFTIAIMFMIFSLQSAKYLSIRGGEQFVKAGQALRNRGQQFLGNKTSGVVAGAFRSTVGRMGNAAANNKGLRDSAATNWTARQAFKLASTASKASYDARQVAGVGKKLGVGEGRKGGYVGRLKEAEEKEKAFLEELGTVSDDDTRVQAQQGQVDQLEGQLKNQKKDLAGTDKPEERAKITGDIQDTEKRLQDARNALEREKNRRQMGSVLTPAEDTEEIQKSTTRITAAKKLLGDKLAQYRAATSNAQRAELDKTVSKLVESLKKEQQAQEESIRRVTGGNAGYIDTIGNRGFFTSMSMRRNRGINRSVAEELGKAYGKKIRKTKEDRATDNIVSAVNKSGADKS